MEKETKKDLIRRVVLFLFCLSVLVGVFMYFGGRAECYSCAFSYDGVCYDDGGCKHECFCHVRRGQDRGRCILR